MKKAERSGLPFFGIGKIIPYLARYKQRVYAMLFCGLLGSVVDIAQPILQRYSINHFIGGGTLDTLPWFIAIYFGTILLSAAANYISCTDATCLEVWIDRDLRNDAFAHLQTLSFSYFNQNSVGYIHARVISDSSRIGSLFSWTLIDGVWQMAYLVGAIIVMLVINAKLALMVLTIMPIIVLLFSVFQSRLVRVNREVREINSKITGNFNEGITGAKTIKTLVIEDKIHDGFVADTAAMRKKTVRAAHLRGLFASTMGFASSLALAIVLWRGGYIAASEVGTFSMFMSYAQGMMEPVRWIIDSISDLITTQVNIERLSKLLETKSDVVDSPEVIKKYGDCFDPKRENWETIKGDIEFDDVSFKYRRRIYSRALQPQYPIRHKHCHSRRDGRGQIHAREPHLPLL